ncbi:hypothetical protein FOZ63_029241 [Perkinsus olseni]|uniref:Peptidase A1 domain-containing protein n=1 Tax=Perkinsus olseni TaxID=32597 RepID=A0A7J6RPP8_PEROL|nr:hypothetical protein FOZ62_020589 [Perkinsus olseni]KAF4722668.1 hypothetical protein FOZ63_029241 [Perkinsus olseni]
MVIYGDGDFYKYVEHTVTLLIDNRTIRDFKFGLVVKYPSRLRGIPAPILGISIGRANIPETFLEQLRRREAITTPSYSIHVKEQGPGVSGTLVLDDSDMTLDHSIAFSKRMLAEGALAASLWPLKLFDPLGNQLEDSRTSGEAKPALVDTGATSLYIPRKDFQKILDVTWETMRKQETSFGIEKSKQLLCDDRWVRMVRKEALPHLPTLAYRIGALPYTIDIRMEPKHYVHSCEALCCQMDVDPKHSGTTSLGHPLFRAYDLTFNLSNRRLYFSSGGKNSTLLTQGLSLQPASAETAPQTEKKLSFFRRLTFRK